VGCPPYGGVVGLLGEVAGRRFHAFDGWCLAHGIDCLRLQLPRLLNLIQWYVIETSEISEEQLNHRRRLEHGVTGAMTHRLVVPAVREPGPRRPWWWTDDEDAGDDALAAIAEMEQDQQSRG
jgi:hypothetical protein